MIFTELELKGLILVEPKVFSDDRGFFLESYNKKLFADNGISVDFVQDNHSRSSKDVLRGLHYQLPPYAQDKLVRVVQGEVMDVVVDVRHDSSTFGQWTNVLLSATNKKLLFVPQGFAHGFVVLSETVDFEYKVSNYYSKEHERGIFWNDPVLAIKWGIATPVLSEKDKLLPLFSELKDTF